MFSFWIVQLTIWLGSIQLSKYDIVENMWSLIPVLFLPPFQLTDHSSRCKTRKYPHFKARSCETLWLWVCQNDRWVSVGKYNVISQTVFRPNGTCGSWLWCTTAGRTVWTPQCTYASLLCTGWRKEPAGAMCFTIPSLKATKVMRCIYQNCSLWKEWSVVMHENNLDQMNKYAPRSTPPDKELSHRVPCV